MKIKKIIIWVFFVIFILLIPSFIFFLSNLAFWPWNNYIFANSINKKLEKIFPKNDLIKLKRADYFYKLWEFDKALEKYMELDCLNSENCFILNHNIANTYYKIWEFSLDQKKLEYWQKSLSHYSKALDNKYNIETKKNYDFVLDKLNKLMEELRKKEQEKPKPEEKQESQKEEEKQESQKEEKKEQDSNTQKEDNENTQSWEEQQEQVIPKWESLKIDETSEKLQKPLSNEDKQEIEKYIEQLKKEEEQNINLNKPKDNRDIFDIFEDDFFFEGFDRNENDW